MQHCVTSPRAPFETSDGTLVVHQIPAWADNLIWLAVDPETSQAAAVDGPEAGPVLDYCEAHGLTLTTILNTHTHGDHIGINHDLKRRGRLGDMRVFGPSRRAGEVPGMTDPVGEGDEVSLGRARGRVMLTEGHIDGHVSYVFDDVLFCGDTMFAGGCGYLFDGPAHKMHRSLSRLAELPGATRVCCAHEYTQDNLRFAWSVDADNDALAQRIRDVWTVRARGECTVPSTIEVERATNPFLRHGDAGLVARLQAAMPDTDLSTPPAVFAATRALKDRKDYKARGDDGLPL